jgi:ubiquinol-cytochrome c reductase cytochrome c subunit
MKKTLAAFVVALAVPALAAGAPPRSGIVHPTVPPGTPLRELGYQLYSGNCASCHGTAGVGVQPSQTANGPGDVRAAGPPLRGVGALAADFYLRTGYMPLAHAGTQPRRSRVLFSPHELDALIAYIASLAKGPEVPLPKPARGSVTRGLTLFTEHCAGCHQIVARGGYLPGAVAPSLDEATPTQIAEAVRIGPYLMPRFSTRAISDRQLDSIVAYVDYAKHPQDPGGWSIGRLGPIPEGMVAWFIAGAALVAACLAIGERARRWRS